MSLLEMELEAKMQEVHVMRNKIALAETLGAHCLSEIEAIHSSNANREATLINKIKAEQQVLLNLDDELADTDETIKDLMYQKAELERKIIEVDRCMQERKEPVLNSQGDHEEVSMLMRKLVALEEETDALSSESTTLQVKEKELDDLIAANKEVLSTTKKEVAQKRHEVSLLEDQYSSHKLAAEFVEVELPKLPTQGNSLFAEVYDSEVKLRAALSQLERRHTKLDLKHSSLVKELSDLCGDLVTLRAGLDGIHEQDMDNEAIKQLKSDLQTVKANGEKIKNKVKEEFQLFGDSNPDSVTRYFTAVILHAWSEITTDISSIIDLRLEGFNETIKFTKAEQETRQMQRTLFKHKVNLVQLKENYRKADLAKFDISEAVHSHYTRNWRNTRIDFKRLHKTITGDNYYCGKLFNVLPHSCRNLEITEFKLINRYLVNKAFYSIAEFITNDFTDLGN